MATSDPTTTIGKALVAIFKACPALKSPGMEITGPIKVEDPTDPNFVKFQSQRQSADFPEICVVQGRNRMGPAHLRNNSSCDWRTQTFMLVYVVDSPQVPSLNQIKEAVNAALQCNPGGITLGLDGLVYSYEMTDGKDDLFGNQMWRRSVQRWTSIVNVNVTYYVQQSGMQNIYNGQWAAQTDPVG